MDESQIPPRSVTLENEPLIRQGQDEYQHPILTVSARLLRTLRIDDGKAITRIFLLYFISYLTFLFVEVPTIRILEYAVCRRHIQNEPDQVSESDCKIPEVQSELALLLGVRVSLEAFAGLIELCQINLPLN